ncbi:hypothetical protein [Bradyrhizobium cosmicum]|uniref:hypothetical protein n=1 Tax=Bradyrhizobium cosmicum TaxID=1404864 RepID=UPI00143D4C29|nr:hypothetical protein [Bradyrhizobium cosmicum]
MGISVTSLMFVEAILDLISTGTMRLDPSDKLEDLVPVSGRDASLTFSAGWNAGRQLVELKCRRKPRWLERGSHD